MALTKVQPSGLDETKDFVVNTMTANTVHANGTIIFPDGTVQNTAWLNVATAITYTTGATAPGDPNLGDVWFNTNDNLKYYYSTDGTSSFWWDTDSIYSGAAFTANNTAPIAPRLGDIWYDMGDGVTYIFSSNGTSTYWQDNTDIFARAQANNAFNKANNSSVIAQSAFDKANTPSINNARTTINAMIFGG